jgi:hypothetical protein
MHPVLRIRILSERYNFYVFGSISTKSKENLTFFQKISVYCSSIENYYTYDAAEKEKKKFQIDTAADKSIFFKNDFQNLSRIRIRIWIGMKMERRMGISTSHASPPSAHRNFFL